MGTEQPRESHRDASPRALSAERLFGDHHEVRIHYRGQEYRLRKTRNGKLILTK